MTALEAFAKELIRASWEGCWDGAEIQEIAEKHGLIKSVPFDPAKHTDSTGYCGVGDPWFVFSGPLAEKNP